MVIINLHVFDVKIIDMALTSMPLFHQNILEITYLTMNTLVKIYNQSHSLNLGFISILLGVKLVGSFDQFWIEDGANEDNQHLRYIPDHLP